jgi:hypothetical protein
MQQLFSGRRLLIATKHGKEKVITPLLRRELGVICEVPEHFDSDRFGTFSGEIPRKDDPLTAAREKCHEAMNACGFDLAVASEGSFGPHPDYFFVPADEELLLLVDRRYELEIIVRVLSVETNFRAATVSDRYELLQFASATGFPEHALILQRSEHDISFLEKGITDEERLMKLFEQIAGDSGSAFVHTDMRAHQNPKRMRVIQTAAERLVEKIKSTCPNCGWPGFSVTGVKTGLRCSTCNFPTRSVRSEQSVCIKCGFQQEKLFPKGKEFEEPMYCDNCNP